MTQPDLKWCTTKQEAILHVLECSKKVLKYMDQLQNKTEWNPIVDYPFDNLADAIERYEAIE